MAKAADSTNRPAKLTVLNTLGYIYRENGIRGLYRGVTPRIALGIWQTICMVSFADYVKVWYVTLSVSIIILARQRSHAVSRTGSKARGSRHDPLDNSSMTFRYPKHASVDNLLLISFFPALIKDDCIPLFSSFEILITRPNMRYQSYIETEFESEEMQH